MSAADLDRVRAALPGLPDDYLDVIGRLDLEAAEFQFIALSPSPYGTRRGEMVRFLVEANGEANPFLGLLAAHRLCEVGSEEGDPICVAARDAARPGEVVRIDHERGTVHRLANGFEQFVVGLARLDEQVYGTGPRGSAGVEAFLASVRQDFGLDDEQLREWRRIAEMALDDEDE